MTAKQPRPARSVAKRAAGGLVLMAMLTACGRFGAPRGGTEQARDISDLYGLMFSAAIAVAAVVYGLILWSLWRYRRRNDDLPPQFRKHIPLEVLYTIVPVLVVGWLFVATIRTENPIDDLKPGPDLVLNVTGFQWQWKFEYPDHGVSITGGPDRPPEIWLPIGERVRITLRAPDVIHSFYVPEFLFKRDAIPGTVNEFDFVVEEEGVFRGECAEYCGLEHSQMIFTIRGAPPAEFEDWIAEQGTESARR